VGGSLWGSTGSFRGSLALSVIESCSGWNGGNYDENPKLCAANAISGWIPYFYTRDWWEQYIDTPEAYQRWRTAMGAFYLDVQDARDLYYLIKSFGGGWLGDTPGFNGNVTAALRSIKASALFIYNPNDQFYTPQHIEAQVKAIPNARAVAIDSVAGHTIWYNADPQATVAMGEAMKAFLSELAASRNAAR
jgi:homoserine O-acetyltransferase